MKDMTAYLAGVPPENRIGARPQVATPTKRASPNRTGAERAAQRRGAGPNSELLALFRGNSFERHYQPGSTILLHGDPADAVYLVVSGTIRCCTVDPEGSRQIFSFPKKGEVLGISDTDYWHFTAEAVDHVILKSMPKATLEQALAHNATLRQEIRLQMRALLERREKQLLTLVSTKASERLYRFLEEFAGTRSGKGHIVLPMCRRDIGDHIGLSMESVSRAFSDLKRKGLIDLKSHEKYQIMARAQQDTGPERHLLDA